MTWGSAGFEDKAQARRHLVDTSWSYPKHETFAGFLKAATGSAGFPVRGWKRLLPTFGEQFHLAPGGVG